MQSFNKNIKIIFYKMSNIKWICKKNFNNLTMNYSIINKKFKRLIKNLIIYYKKMKN